MDTWLVVVVAIAGAMLASVLALGSWARWAARRRNEAGIPTSGRGLMIGRLVGRRLFRKAWLRARMTVASRRRKEELAARAGVRSAEEAVALLGGMKGVFMKVGQIVSFAHDALPEQAKGLLQGLQKDAPPMAFELVRRVIEEELGGDLSRHFVEVEEAPLAAASIGQVHRARLKSGADVVVKVQYPGVDAAIRADLVALERMGKVIAPFSPAFDADAVLAELRARIQDELDYRLEGRSQALFRRLWEGHPLIRVPRVYAAQTTRRILTSEHVLGFGFYDFLREADDRDKRTASATIHDFVFDSMFCHLVYNGDPHPGNYLFHEDGAVTFIDFGCVKRFAPQSMDDIKTFFRAIIEGDRATHDRYVPILGLVRPGRDWDHDNMWAHWRYHLEPYWSEEFTFTPEYLARGREVMAPKNTRDMNLPADLLFFTRITFGLNAIAQQLGSSGAFHQSARRHFYPDDQGASALGLVGVELPDRFRRLPHLHPAGALVTRLESDGTLPCWESETSTRI
jgi:predicted unusual protein kinase regulating ubiquinone biosynthesis (AarF/ABC1/UbiB family)